MIKELKLSDIADALKEPGTYLLHEAIHCGQWHIVTASGEKKRCSYRFEKVEQLKWFAAQPTLVGTSGYKSFFALGSNEQGQRAAEEQLQTIAEAIKDEKARTKRVRIRQIGGDDGYQWCLIVDGFVRYNGMTRSEATWRRNSFITKGD